jgi:hypothetical protein
MRFGSKLLAARAAPRSSRYTTREAERRTFAASIWRSHAKGSNKDAMALLQSTSAEPQIPLTSVSRGSSAETDPFVLLDYVHDAMSSWLTTSDNGVSVDDYRFEVSNHFALDHTQFTRDGTARLSITPISLLAVPGDLESDVVSKSVLVNQLAQILE